MLSRMTQALGDALRRSPSALSTARHTVSQPAVGGAPSNVFGAGAQGRKLRQLWVHRADPWIGMPRKLGYSVGASTLLTAGFTAAHTPEFFTSNIDKWDQDLEQLRVFLQQHG